MSDNRSIQRRGDASRGPQAGAIMTPQGPAVIQIIDVTGAGGHLGYATPGMGNAPTRKVGGINILGAIFRRWWLVLLVTALIGGAGIYVANNFIKPVYIAHTKISWIDRTGDGTTVARLVAQATDVLTSREIPLLAAQDADLQAAMPQLVRGRDLNDPAVQADVVKQLKEIVVAEVFRPTQVVDLQCIRRDPYEAARIANAFSRSFVRYCQDQMTGEIKTQKDQVKARLEQMRLNKAALQAQRSTMAIENRFDADAQLYASTMAQASKMTDDQLAAKVNLAAADAKLMALENGGRRRPDQELQALELVEKEKQKDKVLETYNAQMVTFLATLEQEKMLKKEEHPDVKRAVSQVERLKAQVLQREAEISADIRARIDNQFKLQDQKTVAEAQDAVKKAQQMLDFYTKELAKMDERAKQLVWVKAQLQALDDQIALVGREYDASFQAYQQLEQLETTLLTNSGIRVAEYAPPPDKPDQDKRVKVQAAGMVGGLFLGMLLALLVDKFDKRLRDPRDVEPLLGAPLLGTIPKINELKRIKGEQARNLIAEEFRVIRTQLLFGNPELQHKVIAVTSPQPGDGKTSLAVNLAISIAKAGRRVLLIDSDLRKPDIHRIFNISDTPGFSEVISGSHEPALVIKKSDIDGLDVLPAGTPLTRPSELLSRAEVARTLDALAEVYDHIVLDTAPLLPVSDTHVLAGIVDGVLCSFNAEVDRDTVTMVQDILRRSRANVIGTVMNQVKFKQSGSYHRGKSAYSSYYTSTRVVTPPANNPKLPGKDSGVATMKD
jgi:capsular exopolysaccharide synthesis family protein